MKIRACAVIAVLLMSAGCGDNKAAESPPSATTKSPAATTPTGIASGEPVPARLDVAPGRIGKVEVGMTKAEAAATGYFDTDVEVGGDICKHIEPLQWKKPYQDQVDVLTTGSGKIAAIGVFKSLKTDKGVGIGNTLGEINEAYGDAISPAVEAGYSQTGAYVNIGDNWLGFLVNVEFSKVTPNAEVTFMEVTKGVKPGLMRDGC